MELWSSSISGALSMGLILELIGRQNGTVPLPIRVVWQLRLEFTNLRTDEPVFTLF